MFFQKNIFAVVFSRHCEPAKQSRYTSGSWIASFLAMTSALFDACIGLLAMTKLAMTKDGINNSG